MHEVMPRLTFWLGFVRWLFKGWPLRVWSLVAAYDLVSAQFLPAEFVPPKLIALLKATNIPANVLGVALGLILVFSALEFAYQNRNKVETRPQPKIIKTPGAADISWFDYEHALQPCSSIQHALWRRFSHFEFVFETEKKLHRIEFNQNFVEYFLRDMESMKRGPGGERPASLATP